jgi:hypothetical protein
LRRGEERAASRGAERVQSPCDRRGLLVLLEVPAGCLQVAGADDGLDGVRPGEEVDPVGAP